MASLPRPSPRSSRGATSPPSSFPSSAGPSGGWSEPPTTRPPAPPANSPPRSVPTSPQRDRRVRSPADLRRGARPGHPDAGRPDESRLRRVGADPGRDRLRPRDQRRQHPRGAVGSRGRRDHAENEALRWICDLLGWPAGTHHGSRSGGGAGPGRPAGPGVRRRRGDGHCHSGLGCWASTTSRARSAAQSNPCVGIEGSSGSSRVIR